MNIFYESLSKFGPNDIIKHSLINITISVILKDGNEVKTTVNNENDRTPSIILKILNYNKSQWYQNNIA